MKTIAFTTAQFVRIDYELSPAGFRVLASLLDMAALLIYWVILRVLLGIDLFELLFGRMDQAMNFLWWLLWQIPWLFYSPIMEYLTNGRSLGKFVCGIRVVKVSGETAGLREYFTRWVFRAVDIWLGAFGLLALLFAGTTERRQRLGDIMADTVVIRTRDQRIYSLREVLNIKSQETHTATYTGVTRFSDEDMILLKNAIIRCQRFPNADNRQMILDLSKQTADLIGVTELPKNKLDFLKAVLQDYVVLTR